MVLNPGTQKLKEKNPGLKKFFSEIEKEGKMAIVNQECLSEDIIISEQREKYQDLQGKIFSLWEQYDNFEITTTDLLFKIVELKMK